MSHHFDNVSIHSNQTHVPTEGGFLTGRNPFLFNSANPLPTFIVQLVIILGLSRLVKFIISPIKQPGVIAETISGILLGPTVMGHIPYFTETIFSKPSLPFLNLMAHFGLVLFLFLVGLELDPRMLKSRLRNSLAISASGITLSFSLGVGVAYLLYNYIEPPAYQNGFTTYFLFIGVSMSITALPVLARILTELGMLKTKIGITTISAAACDDSSSWCMLALVISLINSGPGLSALYVFLMGLGYLLFLLFVVRPLLVILLRRWGALEGNSHPSQLVVCIVLGLVFVSAFVTDAIGIHAIFGGFITGIIIPHQGGFAYNLTEKLEDIVQVIFLPLYFALSGLRTSINSLDDGTSWALVVFVICCACFGKIVGGTAAAWFTKVGTWREALTVGCLMNCKGLVELIVLNLGYDAGVISQRTFAIMVIMALTTTFLTVPLVNLIYPGDLDNEDEETKGKKEGNRVLVCVNQVEQVPGVVSLISLFPSKSNSRLDSIGSSPGSNQTSVSSLANSRSWPSLMDAISPSINPHGDVPEEKGKSYTVNKEHKPKKEKKAGTAIYLLRLIELTERDSSVMLQTSPDALKADPVTTVLSAMRQGVKTIVKVVTMSNFGETLSTAAKEVSATHILLTWSNSGPNLYTDSSKSGAGEVRSGRRMSIHTSQQRSTFMQEALGKSAATVLILVGRAEENIANLKYEGVFCPFFGGTSDREALKLTLLFSQVLGGLKVKVVWYKDASKGQDIEDENCFAKCVKEGNLNWHVDETTTPYNAALEHIAGLTSSDLLIAGRSWGSLGFMDAGILFKDQDVDRRGVLGDFAEAALLACKNLNVLVVHSN